MIIILNNVVLPTGMIWENEFNEQLVSQTTKRTLSGSIVIFSGSREKGLNISLSSGPDFGWLKRQVLSTLKSFASQPALIMPLVIGSETFNVVFDHSNQAINAVPVVPFANPSETDYYKAKINLTTC